MPELLARLRVALRHWPSHGRLVEDDLIQVGLLRIDLAAHQAMVVGESLDLTPKEFALLTLLARNPGRVLTHQRILDQVWGPDQSLDTLRTHVSQLRRSSATAPLTPKIVTAPASRATSCSAGRAERSFGAPDLGASAVGSAAVRYQSGSRPFRVMKEHVRRIGVVASASDPGTTQAMPDPDRAPVRVRWDGRSRERLVGTVR